MKRSKFFFLLIIPGLVGCHCTPEKCLLRERFFEKHEASPKTERPWHPPKNSVGSILEKSQTTDVEMQSSVLKLSTTEPDRAKIQIRKRAQAHGSSN